MPASNTKSNRASFRRLLHQLPQIRTSCGEAYAELYLAEPNETARVALTRLGTRVIEDLSTLPGLDHSPWASRYVQGLIDVPFLNLTPGTRRLGVGGERLGQHARNREADSTDQAHDANQSRGFIQPMIE